MRCGFGGSEHCTVLCARLDDKDRLNKKMLQEKAESTGEPIVRIEASHSGGKLAREVKAADMNGLQAVLYLAKGARVMCTWNGWSLNPRPHIAAREQKGK